MRLTAKSEYGLVAMIDLATAENGEPVSVRALAERRSIPQPYLEQLFALLRRAELVTAIRGARGGFVLARGADEISVLDVVEALEGPLTSGVCAAETHEGCAQSSCCAAMPVWNRATEALRDVFSETRLAELAKTQSFFDERVATGGKNR